MGMNTTVKAITDAIERALFGATAEESVALRIRLIDQRIERALDRVADDLAREDEEQDQQG